MDPLTDLISKKEYTEALRHCTTTFPGVDSLITVLQSIKGDLSTHVEQLSPEIGDKLISGLYILFEAIGEDRAPANVSAKALALHSTIVTKFGIGTIIRSVTSAGEE
ncbi:hypothetical protein P9112_005095 [Eukaryota sp. TZLM1-RC]